MKVILESLLTLTEYPVMTFALVVLINAIFVFGMIALVKAVKFLISVLK